MPVQTGQRKKSQVLASMLMRDVVQRRLAATSEVLLACGVLDHHAGRMGRLNYCFEESASVVLLLRGGGWYREGDTVSHRLAPGDVFVRLPGRLHMTIPDADGQWVEFFLHLPKSAWAAAEFAGLMHGSGSSGILACTTICSCAWPRYASACAMQGRTRTSMSSPPCWR